MDESSYYKDTDNFLSFGEFGWKSEAKNLCVVCLKKKSEEVCPEIRFTTNGHDRFFQYICNICFSIYKNAIDGEFKMVWIDFPSACYCRNSNYTKIKDLIEELTEERFEKLEKEDGEYEEDNLSELKDVLSSVCISDMKS